MRTSERTRSGKSSASCPNAPPADDEHPTRALLPPQHRPANAHDQEDRQIGRVAEGLRAPLDAVCFDHALGQLRSSLSETLRPSTRASRRPSASTGSRASRSSPARARERHQQPAGPVSFDVERDRHQPQRTGAAASFGRAVHIALGSLLRDRSAVKLCSPPDPRHWPTASPTPPRHPARLVLDAAVGSHGDVCLHRARS